MQILFGRRGLPNTAEPPPPPKRKKRKKREEERRRERENVSDASRLVSITSGIATVDKR